MGWLSLLTLAVALAMDAFAVAVVTGLTLNVLTGRHLFRLAFHFGLFQAIMLAIGWSVGAVVQHYIAAADHWIAFGLLAVVGGNIIRNALRSGKGERHASDLTTGWDLVLVSVATSIDALAVGLSLGVIGTGIIVPAAVVGLTASLFTLAGMGFGRRISSSWGPRVEVLGGLILIAIGLHVLWQHLR